MSGANDVVLDLQIFDEEFYRLVVVRLDPADFRGGQNHDRWFLSGKKTVDRLRVAQIQGGAVAHEQTGKAVCLELSNERAANQPAMARDKDFVRFFHAWL